MASSIRSDAAWAEGLGLGVDALAQGLPGGFFAYEATGEERIVYANRQMADIFRCKDVADFLEFVGGTFPGLVYYEDRLRVENAIWSKRDSASFEERERRDHMTYRVVARDGSLHYLSEYGSLVHNTAYGDLFFVFVAEATPADITNARVGQRHLSIDVDSLTGLPTMRFYHAHVGEVLAKAAVEGRRMADVYLDVDNFRTVNFRLGYEGGDEVLTRIALVLTEVFEGDLIARFADDHFVLVTDAASVEARLEEVHARLRRAVAGMPIELKAGVFELPLGVTTIPFAHDRAKVACASIKGRYDRHVRYFDELLANGEQMRSYIVDSVELAVERGWIQNYYQPVVRVATGECCGLEALSRWVDPVRGMFPPAAYVNVLEQARLVHLLDRAVIGTACVDIHRMLERTGSAISVSLNYSPSSLSLLDVPELLKEHARAYNIDPSLLHVEITESSLAEDPGLLRDVIARLHEDGFEVWMDDFGSGYSSLNLLKDYDFDVLKVDMAFMRGMEGSERSRTIVASILDLAHSLGMSTLVEGVETAGQLEFLRTVGADRAQGYYFSEPVPLDALIEDFFVRYAPVNYKDLRLT